MVLNIDPTGFKWDEYLKEERPITAEPADHPARGSTYLFVREYARGIILVSDECDGDNDVRGKLLARNPRPGSENYENWAVGRSETKFYCLRANAASPLRPVSSLFDEFSDVTDDWVAATAQANRRPSPQARPKGVREVSVDGVLYIPYDSMADSDPFESYPYYRVKEADGSFSIDERPVALKVSTIDHCYECGSKQGPFGYTNRCYPCYEQQEKTKATQMRERDAVRGSQVRRAAVQRPIVQSHATLWGGVISLRE